MAGQTKGEIQMSQSPERRLVDSPDLQVVPPAPTRIASTEHATESAAGVVQRERVVTDEGGLAHSERTVHDVAGEQRLGLYRVTQLIWLVFGIIEGLIGLRVILKLIGANPENAFAAFVYDAAAIFLNPFFSLTGSPTAGAMVLEIPSILAMIVYALLGWVLVRIVHVVWPMFSRSSTSTTSTYDRY
jgi:uncharacterized membrane protein